MVLSIIAWAMPEKGISPNKSSGLLALTPLAVNSSSSAVLITSRWLVPSSSIPATSFKILNLFLIFKIQMLLDSLNYEL